MYVYAYMHTTARTLQNGWNFKVRFGGVLRNCLLVAETYGANDEARWCLLRDFEKIEIDTMFELMLCVSVSV